ncbi:MAG: non-homologous end-joining DNA ligase [Kiloniellaceae bacterium]
MTVASKDTAEKRKATLDIDGRRIELSNLAKVLFPADGFTKGEVIGYYRRIAETALPHYRDRPVTLQRFPDGIAEPGFYQKDLPDYFPGWIDRVELPKEDGRITHMIAGDVASLVYIANQGCITPHLALARRDRPAHPDRLVFDFDPFDDDFGKVQEAALQLKRRLDALDLPAFVMTTGSRGLHVVVPLDRSADFDAVRGFARDLAGRLADSYPDALTVEQRKNQRGNRVFIDYLRNAYGQTAVAPYALRARDGAPVATPLTWEEAAARGLQPRRYTLKNIFRRLAQRHDPWRSIGDKAVALQVAQERLDRVRS